MSKAIDFQTYADTNTFSNVYFEDVATCITFYDDPSGNTDAFGNAVFTPFFGANTTTDISQGGVNNRVIENVTTWVKSETHALKQGRLPTDVHPRVRYNANGSIVAGDGAEDLTNSSKVVSLKPRIAASGNIYYQLQPGTSGDSEDILKAEVGTYQTIADANAHDLITRDITGGDVWLVHVYVVANQTDGTNRAFYAKRAMFYRRSGQNASQQGSTSNIFSDVETDASWGGVTVDVNSNTVRARVTGKSGVYIDWRGYMEVISIKE